MKNRSLLLGLAVVVLVIATSGAAYAARQADGPASPEAPSVPRLSVYLHVSPNPSTFGQTVAFTWTALGFPTPNVVCNDNRGWVINGPSRGTVYKIPPYDFDANFTWTVTCEDENFAATNSLGVVTGPPRCGEPPEFYTQPTISGTPLVGSVVTSTSGDVWCANYLRPNFFRTDANGNIVATVKVGAIQTCPYPGWSTCSRSDTYTLTYEDAGYYIKVKWVAWRPPPTPPVEATTPLLGPIKIPNQ